MNREVLRHRDFWAVLRTIAEEGPTGHGAPILADWLDEHDSPIRAHILRHGVPITAGTIPGGWRDAGSPARWVRLKDEGSSRFLGGHPGALGDSDEPLSEHVVGPEHYQLFRAYDFASLHPLRYVVRYRILGTRGSHVDRTAPLSSAHLRTIGDAWQAAWDAANPDSLQRPWNHWHQAAEQQEWHEQHATHLAREGDITLGPGERIVNHIHHTFYDSSGKELGRIRLSERPAQGKNKDEHHLFIHYIGRTGSLPMDDQPNSIGPELVRPLGRALAAAYPHATHFAGDRISGQRAGTGIANQAVVIPIRRPNGSTRLARVQAGQNGEIANNRMFSGGQFIERSRKRIRDVASRLVKLARRPDDTDYATLVQTAADAQANFDRRENPQPTDRPDLSHRAVLADWMEEHGIPGAHVVRARALAGQTVRETVEARRAMGRTGHSGPIVTLSDTPAVSPGGPGSPQRIVDLINGSQEAAAGRVTWRTGGNGVVVHTRHLSPTGAHVHSTAHALTADELLHLVSDWPVEARRAALQPLIDDGTLRRVLRGRGKGSLKLARKPEPVDVSAKGLIGRGPTGPPLTLAELRAIEARHKLPRKHWLSPHVTQAVKGDHLPFKTKTEQVSEFLRALSAHAIGKPALKRLLADKNVSAGVRMTHLIAQLEHDYGTSTHPTGDASWYGGRISYLDRAIHRIVAGGKSHPLWGTMGADGELVGKAHPAENHPANVLLKAVIASTSGNANPVDNLRAALRAWAAGRAANGGSGHPILDMPDYNHETLEQWVQKAKKLSGVKTAKQESDLRNPGSVHLSHDPHKIARWYTRFAAHPELQGEGITGYAGMDARINPTTGRVIWYDRNGKKTLVDPSAEGPEARNVTLPFTFDGGLRPKGWGMYGTQIATRLALLKGLFAYHAERNPRGSEQEHMRDVARWLTTDHEREEFDRKSEALKPYVKNWPGLLKPHLVHSDAVFSTGLADKKEDKLPGMMILGPKFGSFALNLLSNDPATRERWRKYLVADKWWTRNFTRYLGDMRDTPGVNERRRMVNAAHTVSGKLGVTPADLQADLWFHEKNLYGMFGAGKGSTENLSYQDAADQMLGPTGELRSIKLARPEVPWAWWMDPTGELHDVGALIHRAWIEKHKHLVPVGPGESANDYMEHAFNKGWLRVTKMGKSLIADNNKRTASETQRKALKDHALAQHIEDVQMFGPRGEGQQKVRLARSLHESLNALLAGRNSARKGKHLSIHKKGESILVYKHGKKLVTAWSDGTVRKHEGKFYKEREQPAQLARKKPPTPHRWTTLPWSDPELRDWMQQVIPHTPKKYLVDHTAAGALADRLEERNDWRHHILRRLAMPVMGGVGRTESWNRPDGVFRFSTDSGTPGRERVEPFGPDSESHSVWDNATPNILVHTRWPLEGAPFTFSVHTPEEYERMRADAKTAGVAFPRVPK